MTNRASHFVSFVAFVLAVFTGGAHVRASAIDALLAGARCQATIRGQLEDWDGHLGAAIAEPEMPTALRGVRLPTGAMGIWLRVTEERPGELVRRADHGDASRAAALRRRVWHDRVGCCDAAGRGPTRSATATSSPASRARIAACSCCGRRTCRCPSISTRSSRWLRATWGSPSCRSWTRQPTVITRTASPANAGWVRSPRGRWAVSSSPFGA